MSIESISSIVSIPDGKLIASVVSFETCESKDASKQKYTASFNFQLFKKRYSKKSYFFPFKDI